MIPDWLTVIWEGLIFPPSGARHNSRCVNKLNPLINIFRWKTSLGSTYTRAVILAPPPAGRATEQRLSAANGDAAGGFSFAAETRNVGRHVYLGDIQPSCPPPTSHPQSTSNTSTPPPASRGHMTQSHYLPSVIACLQTHGRLITAANGEAEWRRLNTVTPSDGGGQWEERSVGGA